MYSIIGINTNGKVYDAYNMLEFKLNYGALTDETIKIFYTLNERKHFFYNPYNLYMNIICLFVLDRVNVWETMEF